MEHHSEAKSLALWLSPSWFLGAKSTEVWKELDAVCKDGHPQLFVSQHWFNTGSSVSKRNSFTFSKLFSSFFSVLVRFLLTSLQCFPQLFAPWSLSLRDFRRSSAAVSFSVSVLCLSLRDWSWTSFLKQAS